ncbi:hypothetical protein C0J52_11376, partial [Blattella germanica]
SIKPASYPTTWRTHTRQLWAIPIPAQSCHYKSNRGIQLSINHALMWKNTNMLHLSCVLNSTNSPTWLFQFHPASNANVRMGNDEDFKLSLEQLTEINTVERQKHRNLIAPSAHQATTLPLCATFTRPQNAEKQKDEGRKRTFTPPLQHFALHETKMSELRRCVILRKTPNNYDYSRERWRRQAHSLPKNNNNLYRETWLPPKNM